MSPDIATILALRSDLALQLARYIQRLGVTQLVAAERLGLPQPTLSKIINGRVDDVSLELLIRVAVRAGLPLTLQTGHAPQEAGVFTSRAHSDPSRASPSKLGDAMRQSLIESEGSLTATQRLEAFLEHNQLLGALRQAAGNPEAARRARKALHEP